MRLRIALLLSLLCAAPGVGAAALSTQAAEARATGGGQLLYREQHLLRESGGRPQERLVLYRCPSGAAFARKHVDYGASAQAPAFAFEDRRSGYAEGMRRLANGAQLYFRERAGVAERAATLQPAPAVVDAGFDEFIRAHWASLLKGETMPLQFAIPARLGAMDFEVKRVGATKLRGEDAEVFRLRLDGLLGWIAPHFDVTYGGRSHRLLRFEGLSNLRDARAAKMLEVRIDFAAPAQPAPEADWGKALSETLVAGCESGQGADSPAVRTAGGAR